MELTERLRRLPLFEHLSEDHLQLIADLCERHVAKPRTRLTRQAELGATYFLIDEGECVIRRIDERGMMRPVGMLKPGDGFGTASLFLGERRDATVVALTEVHYWTLHRNDLEDLLADEPSLRNELNIPPEIRDRLGAPRYPWLERGESIILNTHRHWIALVRSLWASTVAVILYVTALILLASGGRTHLPWATLWLPLLPVYGGGVLWHWIDWRNDYFAVSTRRVSHCERVALFYESRQEAPLDRIQNINVERGPLGQLLGFGDLTVQTAADVGAIMFTFMRQPERVREAIWSEVSRAQSMRRAAERERIRQALRAHMDLEADELKAEVAPDETPIDLMEELEPPEVKPGLVPKALIWLAKRELIPQTRIEEPGQVTWRKHWIFLVIHAVPPLILTIAAGSLALLVLFGAEVPVVSWIPYRELVLLLLTILGMGWLWWDYTEWGNDLYTVTEERIIDVEKRPLFFSEARREASLGMIQNVSLEIPNPVASVFNYGNVLVQTAGAGDFTFDRAPNPRGVQAEIFRRMQAFRERQQEREAERRRAELAEWFGVYDELKGEQPPATGEEPQEGEEPPQRDRWW